MTEGGDECNLCQFVLLFIHSEITICEADSIFDSQ